MKIITLELTTLGGTLCDQVYPVCVKDRCPPGNYDDYERVFGIDFSPRIRPRGTVLLGTLPTEMGYLDQARVWYLLGNQLTYVLVPPRI